MDWDKYGHAVKASDGYEPDTQDPLYKAGFRDGFVSGGAAGFIATVIVIFSLGFLLG